MPERERPSAAKVTSSPPEADASLYLHPQTLARLSSFELRAKAIIEGVSSGTHRSPFQGFSVEFAQHRPYVAGDDIRHLDWKVFGRTDRLQVKQYQQETNLDLILLVDASGSMGYGSRSFAEASGVGRETSPDGRLHWSKFDHATALAAALAYITLRQGDRVGLEIFDDKVRYVLKRSGSQGTWRQIVGALASHPAGALKPSAGGEQGGGASDIRRAVNETLAQVTNRCVIAIISDFFMDVEAIRDAIARCKHARADVMAFQIMDNTELTFDSEEINDAVSFAGLEGEGPVKVDPRSIREAYVRAVTAHVDEVQRSMKSFGYDHRVVNTHEWLGPSLAAFVARRNAQIQKSKFG